MIPGGRDTREGFSSIEHGEESLDLIVKQAIKHVNLQTKRTHNKRPNYQKNEYLADFIKSLNSQDSQGASKSVGVQETFYEEHAPGI